MSILRDRHIYQIHSVQKFIINLNLFFRSETMTVSLILVAVVSANFVLGTGTSIASPKRVMVKRQINQPWNEGHHHHHRHQDLERRCFYWCQTSQNRYYCCDSGFPGANPLQIIPGGQYIPGRQTIPGGGIISGGNKPGSCPPQNPFCMQWSGGSEPCTVDQHCRWRQKCCFDTCLKYNICKRPLIPFMF